MTSEIRTNSITSRAGMSTVTMTDSGPMFSGITTFVDNSGFTFGVGGGTSIFTPATNVLTFGTNNTEKIRIDASGHMHGVGVITATHFYGDGSNLTGISAGTALSGSTNNTVCTVTGANAIQGESNLTFDGTQLKIGGDSGVSGTFGLEIYNTDSNEGTALIAGTAGARLDIMDTGSSERLRIAAAGAAYFISYNSGDPFIFQTTDGSGTAERLRITSGGFIGAGTANPRRHFHLHNSASATVGFQMTNGNTGESNDSQGFQLKVASDSHAEISQMENSDLRIFTNASERLRITSTGKFGINYAGNPPSEDVMICTAGQASPGGLSLSHLSGGNRYGARLQSISGTNQGISISSLFNSSYTEKLRITSTDATLYGATDGVLNLDTTDSRGSFIRFQQGGATEAWVGCGQGLSLGGKTTLALRSDADIRIRTGSEEHVTITSTGYLAAKGEAGNWIYGNHPSNYTFHQFSSSKNGDWMMQLRQEHHNGLGFVLRTAGSGNNEAIALYRENTTTYGFKVYQNGNVQNSNNSYGSLSDVSLKENIVDAKSQWDDIKAIKVRNFNLKSDTDKVKMLGVVAQELETVSPKLIYEDKEGIKGVHYSVLYMKAIKALQEAMTRIETLEQENIALRVRVTNLEGE